MYLLLFEDAAVRALDGHGERNASSNALGNRAEILELRQSPVEMAERFRRNAESHGDLDSGDP